MPSPSAFIFLVARVDSPDVASTALLAFRSLNAAAAAAAIRAANSAFSVGLRRRRLLRIDGVTVVVVDAGSGPPIPSG